MHEQSARVDVAEENRRVQQITRTDVHVSATVMMQRKVVSIDCEKPTAVNRKSHDPILVLAPLLGESKRTELKESARLKFRRNPRFCILRCCHRC